VRVWTCFRQKSASRKRSPKWLAKFAVAAGVVTAALVAAAAQESSLSPGVYASTNLLPRAFLKDRHLRLYSGGTNEREYFMAEWHKARAPRQEFSYQAVTLKRRTSSRLLPSASSSWREIRVLGLAQGDRLLRALVTDLAPAQQGHAVYVQHALGDVTLFRDATGSVQVVPFEATPPGMTVDRRYNRQELSSAAAQLLDKELRAGYPNETAFVLHWRRAGRIRITFFDLVEHETVVLFPPDVDSERRWLKLGGKLTTLASFAVVDNLWAFLKNPVSSTTRTIHQGWQWAGTLLEPRLRPKTSGFAPITNAPGMDLVAWERWLDKHAGTSRERGSLRLLVNGETFFPEFERRVGEARSKIDIHVCIFDRDDVAVGIADLLKARSTNVTVRVVFDRLNTRRAAVSTPATPMAKGFVPPRSISAYLRKYSEVRVRPLLNPGFSCDHSKVFVIDDRYAYIGGMNLGREYRYEWHDLMAEVEGPVVASVERQFNKKWAQAGVWGDCGLAAETLCGKSPCQGATNRAEWLELRRLYTKTFDRQIRRAELEAISRARDHVFLENAYLYNNQMILALANARRRGVDVRVIMPGENDTAAGHRSNLVTSNFLRRNGVRVFFYPGMSHVKALLVDGWVCFGSANFDALSLRLNREADLATSDAEFGARFRREVFDTDFAKARELQEDIDVGWSDHLSDLLLNPF